MRGRRLILVGPPLLCIAALVALGPHLSPTRLDDLTTPAATLLRQLPGVVSVEKVQARSNMGQVRP